MSSREMTLMEELQSLANMKEPDTSVIVDISTLKRLIHKLKKEHEMYDQCREYQREIDEKSIVLEHDNHIQEQIILQLIYEKYKHLVDK